MHERRGEFLENYMNGAIFTRTNGVMCLHFIQNVSENCSRFRLSACTYLHLACAYALLTNEFSSSISLQSEQNGVSVCTSEYRALDIKTTNNARTYVFIRFLLLLLLRSRVRWVNYRTNEVLVHSANVLRACVCVYLCSKCDSVVRWNRTSLVCSLTDWMTVCECECVYPLSTWQ